MKNLKIYICFCVIVATISAQGQQTIRFSNYLFNKMILNPAAVGMNDFVEVSAAYRKQWTGINGAPSTSVLSAESPFKKRQFGGGAQIIQDNVGALKTTGITLYGAPRVRLSSNQWLSAGIGVGVFSTTLNGGELTYRDQSETVIPQVNESVTVIDFKLGVYYKDDKNFGGISIFNLVQPHISYINSDVGVQGKLTRHYYFMGGRKLKLDEANVLVPSVLFKFSENFNKQLDLNIKYVKDGIYALGFAYRTNDSFGITAEYLHLKSFRIGYAFDFTVSDFSPYTGTTHEFMISYRFSKEPEMAEDPRYLYN